MYNLDVYPIHYKAGKAEPQLPGLLALNPPRRCGRGRELDQLIALVHLVGKMDLTGEVLEKWLDKKAALFYSSPGSVTNALRLMAEAINSELLERNLKKAGTGPQVNGSLCLVVIRKDILYTLVIGQARIFVMNSTTAVEYGDSSNHARGLGVTQSINCHFNQLNIAGDESILLAPTGSPQWTLSSLEDAGKLAAEELGARLLVDRPLGMRAALIRLGEGSGQIVVRSLAAVSGGRVESSDKAGFEPAVVEQPASRSDLKQVHEPASQQAELPLPLPGFEPEGTRDEPGVEPVELPTDAAASQAEIGQVRSIRLDRRQMRGEKGLQKDAKRGLRQERKAERKQDNPSGVSDSPLTEVLKKTKAESVTVPRYLYLLFAIAVPLVVVAIAVSVYINQGRTQQFTYYLNEGQKYAALAADAKDDPVMHSFNLQASLMYLQKASQFGSTEESSLLVASIQQQLDELQGVVRLNMRPLALSERPGDVNISQIVASNTDLYMLDSKSGRVLHYDLFGEEYVLDKGFDCGPNPDNPLNSIGKLVDIIGLPTGNSFGATIFGIDGYGNIEFCIPGESGVVSSLIAPDAGWQEIKAVSMYQNYLYILDPGNNAVFSYAGTGILFEDKPRLFFDNVIPDMGQAVDIDVYADELYILRSNGEMVECTYSHMKSYKLTECMDPAPYNDMRAGQTAQAVSFPDSQFVQMRMTPAPDSSLYLLDAHGTGIYHFSLQRNLQKIYQPGFTDPEYSPKGAVTSVGFSPGKAIFMAFGNQIYSGVMP